ncbi:hypothetical protein VCR14J2_390387 [Vibrio coralliirubri]|uniref:hypothetical protein n=1 Tax=Vibrio coralliirubri TaxID=1516159 RepID=UPI0006358FA8|nr:hypothetical protein [Vibrio coralliirubri]CDU05791.1 hypothetical protein VCR14J2_390387 [Vibrio coralliirubri]
MAIEVAAKPVIEKLEDLEVSFLFEGNEYKVFVTPFGSSRYFAASKLLSQSENQGEQAEGFNQYVATLITGWDSPEFFGGEYSHQLALTICDNPKNIWFTLAVSKQVTETVKK